MIKVTIDMWPGGDSSRSYRLGSIDITNTGRGTAARGSYVVKFYNKLGQLLDGRTCSIDNWAREKCSIFSLVKQALTFGRY